MSRFRLSHALGRLAPPLTILGVALTVGAVAAFSQPQVSTNGRESVPPLTVAVAPAVLEPGYTEMRRSLGTVEAARRSVVGFELSGRIAEVALDEGAPVVANEPVARLDTALLDAQRKELEAAHTQAAARAALARSTLERLANALADNAVSRQEHDEGVQSVAASEAEESRILAQIATLDVQLEKSILRAPFDAVVVRRLVDEGRVVAAGSPVLELLERGALEARISLPARGDVPTAGRLLSVQVGDASMDATVRHVVPVRDGRTRAVEIIVTLPDTAEAYEGDLVVVDRPRRTDVPGIWLPLDALTEARRGLWACFVASSKPDGRWILERRELEVLHHEGARAFVRGTLAPKELVVQGGAHKLVPGLPVRLADAGGAR